MASIPGTRSAAYWGVTEAKRAVPRLVLAALVQVRESRAEDGTGGMDEAESAGCCHRLAWPYLALLPLLWAKDCGDTYRNGCSWNAAEKGDEPATSRAATAATTLGMVGVLLF